MRLSGLSDGLARAFLPARDRLGAPLSALLVATLAVPFIGLFLITLLRTNAATFPYLEKASFYIGMGGMLVGCALGSLRATSARTKAAGSAAGGTHAIAALVADVVAAAMLVATVVVLVASGMTPGPALVGVLSGGGVAFAWLTLRAFDLAWRLGMRRAYGAVLAAFVVAALVRLAFTLMPSTLDIVAETFLLLALPLAFVAVRVVGMRLDATEPSASESAGDASPDDRPARGPAWASPSVGTLAPPMLELVVCALALGIFAGKAEAPASTAESIVNLLLRTVIALILLLLVDARDRHLTLRPVQASVAAAALVLLTVSFLGGQGVGDTISRALFSLARNFALVAIYLMALRLTLNDGIHPFVSLGLLRGTYELAQGVGIVLDVRFAVSDLPLLTASNTAFFVAAIVMVIVANRLVSFSADLYGDAGETLPSADSTDIQAQANRMAERCRRLGEQYGLTAREVEIVALMCAGASKSRIADELVLSVNTVRWHAQNAYAKLGVHSKEELLRLVG